MLRGNLAPDADAWSLLEVVNHLYDEEREDDDLERSAVAGGHGFTGLLGYWISALGTRRKEIISKRRPKVLLVAVSEARAVSGALVASTNAGVRWTTASHHA